MPVWVGFGWGFSRRPCAARSTDARRSLRRFGPVALAMSLFACGGTSVPPSSPPPNRCTSTLSSLQALEPACWTSVTDVKVNAAVSFIVPPSRRRHPAQTPQRGTSIDWRCTTIEGQIARENMPYPFMERQREKLFHRVLSRCSVRTGDDDTIERQNRDRQRGHTKLSARALGREYWPRSRALL